MRRRWLLGSALGLVVAAALAVVLAWRVGLDAYRGRIEQIVTGYTGRPFHLYGPIELHLAPLAVVTGPAELGNPPGMTGPPLATWRSARIGLDLLPLLHHRLVIDRVRLDGLQVHLRRAADGRANWAGLPGVSGGAGQPGGGSGGSSGPDGSGARGGSRGPAGQRSPGVRLDGVMIDTIQLGGLDIRDGAIDLDDRMSRRHVEVSRVQLDVGPSRFGPRVEIGRVRLSARARVDERAQASGARTPMSAKAPSAGGGTGLSGGGSSGGHWSGTAEIPLRLDLAGISASSQPRELSVPRWSLNVANAQLEGSLMAAADPGGDLNAHGAIAGSTGSVRQLTTALGVDVPFPPDPRAFGALTLAGDWSWAGGALTVQSLRMHLDDTTLTGRIVREPAGGRPLITFDLRGDHIDLDRYTARGGAPRKPFELPVATLRALRIAGSVTFDEARFADVELKNARLTIPGPPT